MICLTGDLHHQSLGTGNQYHCDISEIQVAQRYMAMLREAGVKVTFFISGRAFDQQWDELQPICDDANVEIGGHNYSCFTPSWWHRFWNKTTGNYNGPMWYQERDTRRTIHAIKRRTGRTITSWRNHMYMHGPNTEQVLAKCGIRICSDGVRADATGPMWHPAGLFNFKINVIPDHEHIYHAERTRQWVYQWVQRYNWSDDYGSRSYPVEEWSEIALDCLHRNEERGAISNMLVHPITLYLSDRFKSFERILDYLSGQETVHLSEVHRHAVTALPATAPT